MKRLNITKTVIAGSLAVSVLGFTAPAALVTRAFGPTSGLQCTAGASPAPVFNLKAVAGTIALPDGNSAFMWSFANASGGFQFPGPVLCVTQGDLVTINLTNTLPEPVSIQFPGQEDVWSNGAPDGPQFDGNGALTSLAATAAAVSGTVSYTFTASQPGTYQYESGTDLAKQIQMGLVGALVVRPAGHTDQAYDDTGAAFGTQFNQQNEYMMLTTELDPDLHQAVERNTTYDFTKLRPRYWMINGRSFPDTIAPNGAAWLPNQPYSALIHMHPLITSTVNVTDSRPALVRFLSFGTRNHPIHPHGNHGRVIARDGQPLRGEVSLEDLSYEKFLVMLGAGQTWDALYTWTDVEGWNPATNPVPVTVTQQLNQIQGRYYAGSPYLGVKDELPVGTTSDNQCGEYYQMWHSHALNESANWDASFGGMMTFQRIDPPLSNSPSNTCPQN